MAAKLRSLKARNAPFDLGKYPESGQRIMLRGYDLMARFWLTDRAEECYNEGETAASATLMHAAYYLGDRLAYQLSPAPKNCIRIDEELSEIAGGKE